MNAPRRNRVWHYGETAECHVTDTSYFIERMNFWTTESMREMRLRS